MIFKGSGLFKDSPDVTSPAGLTVLAGVGVMLIGVVLASLAGFGRDRELKRLQQTSGSFLGGLIMTIVAGITSAGIMLAFVYAQGPIVARVTMIETGGTAPADSANVLAVFPVWAVALLGGALVNIVYPSYLMTKNKSWSVLLTSWPEVCLSIVIGFQFCLAIALAGKGMVLLGVLGASVGAGIQQVMQMIGGQGLGFISGEWRGVYGTPRRQMYLAIAVLLIASIVMAYANKIVT